MRTARERDSVGYLRGEPSDMTPSFTRSGASGLTGGIQILPNPAALLRLATPLVIESHDESQVTRRHLSDAAMGGLRAAVAKKQALANATSLSIQYDSLITTHNLRLIRRPLLLGTRATHLSVGPPRAAANARRELRGHRP